MLETHRTVSVSSAIEEKYSRLPPVRLPAALINKLNLRQGIDQEWRNRVNRNWVRLMEEFRKLTALPRSIR